jgi:hypothetical protein
LRDRLASLLVNIESLRSQLASQDSARKCA